MDLIRDIKRHVSDLGRPPMFGEAMTTLAFRIEERTKKELKSLAGYLSKDLQEKYSAGAIARAFIASGLKQIGEPVRDVWKRKISEHSRGTGEEALTTLSVRLERGLKKEIGVVSKRLSHQVTEDVSIGAMSRAFIASGLQQMRTQYPDLRKFLGQQRIENNGGKVPAAKEKSPPKESLREGRGRKK